MKKYDKIYTIKYSKSGYYQYANFYCLGEKVLDNNSFNPSYTDVKDVPSLDGIENINEILEIIKKFSYCNRAEIYLINHCPVKYYENKNIENNINDCEKSFESFINNLALNFFKKELLPIIKKNEWKISYSLFGSAIFIEKVKGEWDNIDSMHEDRILIDFICNKFINNVIGLNVDLELCTEQNYVSCNSFKRFFNYISENDLVDLQIFERL